MAGMVEATNDRTRALVEAGIALASELSLDAVLQKLVDTAAELTGARYAALGVIDPGGRRLERFVTTGVDEATIERIGDLPAGHGILGLLIRDAHPLRLHDLREDPHSVGFPPHHPEMTTFLGMPILLRGTAYGNLYLTEKEGGADFTAEDEELTGLLAAQAAVAIENARLYESATRWLSQLESLNEVGNALITEVGLSRQLALVAERLRELLGARIVTVNLPNPDGSLRIAAADGDRADDLLGTVVSARSKTASVLASRRAQRVDAMLDDPDVDQTAARLLGAQTGLYVPLVAHDRAIGVIDVHDRLGADPRFTDDDLRLAESFASRAAVAVDLSERVARDSLRRVVEAQEIERRRLARELHDETGQALTSILLGLHAMEDAKTDEQVRAAATDLRELVVRTLQDVRQLAVELRPKALDDFGLVAALERLVETWEEQTGIRVELSSRLPGRLPAEIETALYRIVQEALTNIVKHARASRVSIVLSERGHTAAVLIEDDGIGFAPAGVREEGLGLVGMRERVALVGGRLEIESRAGAGTTLSVEVPLP
jgi:signal transduction histidine kinase